MSNEILGPLRPRDFPHSSRETVSKLGEGQDYIITPNGAETLLEKVITVRKEYDFSRAQKNPYAPRLKRQITLRMDEGAIGYFKSLAQDRLVEA